MATDNRINNLLIPQISKLPEKKVSVNQISKESDGKEFLGLLNKEVISEKEQGLQFSTHAARRIQERNLNVDGDEYFKLQTAINKLKDKGGRDSLVITKNAAYIVDVARNTVVTAIDKNNMAENVFTKIDSTLVVD